MSFGHFNLLWYVLHWKEFGTWYILWKECYINVLFNNNKNDDDDDDDDDDVDDDDHDDDDDNNNNNNNNHNNNNNNNGVFLISGCLWTH